MLRFVLSAMAIAGILATTLQAFADHFQQRRLIIPELRPRHSAARPTGPVVAIGWAGV
jgi:hypothetical protein